MRTPIADVLIVGGGPAGATAALNLAPFHRVLVVEAQGSPTARIGESLAPSAKRLLTDMGLWEDFLLQGHSPCHGNQSLWGEGPVAKGDSIRDLDGPGWHLDRVRFDHWLRSIAIKRGAEFIAPANLSDIYRDGEVWIASIESEGRILSVRSRFLIDATGRTASVARRLGSHRENEDRLACGWLYGTDAAEEVSETTFVESTPDGWWYTAPLPSNRRVLAFHTDADLPTSEILRSPEAILESARSTVALSELLARAGFAPESVHGVIAASGSLLRPCAGEGWLAVGDAATAFDPLSSQGLLNALYTGLAGAESANRYLEEERFAIEEYVQTIDRIWTAYAQHRKAWYGLERRWPERPFWKRRIVLI